MKYQLFEHITITEVDNQVVLLDMQEGQYFGVNHIGAKLLNLLQNNFEVEQAILEIADSYKIEYNSVKDDIDSLLKQLLEQKILQHVEE